MESFTIHFADLAATEMFGHELGRLLFPGAVVGLVGPLGAGKTYLVRAIAEGLQVTNSRVVNSPTFVLIQEYDARLPIYHFDAYRLNSDRDFLDLGVIEYMEGKGVCLIEWSDRVQRCLPSEHFNIVLEVTGAITRRATVSSRGSRYLEVLQQLRIHSVPSLQS